MKHRKSADTHHATKERHAPAEDAQTHTDEPKSDDEIMLDFSGVKSFFRKVDANQVVVWAFVLFCLALVFAIRMLPAALPVTDSWADSTIRQNVRSQVSSQIDQQFPSLPQANRDALIDRRVNEIIAEQQAAFDATKAQLSAQFKDQLRYTGEDGKTYTYLGDLDSYFWTRYARNVLEHGNACDAVVDGTCRDMHILAPVGGQGSFNPSFHVFAIVGLYKLINLFHPNYPITATSFLVQALLGALSVIPAFFVGRRLAGNVGGLFAALLISLHPLYLSRSLGSDTDLWIITVSLFALWMIIEAVEAKSLTKRIIFATLASAAMGLFAAAWTGWWFFYVVILVGLIGALLFWVLTALVRKRERRPWKDDAVQRTAVILVVFYLATFIFLLFAGESTGYFRRPLDAVYSRGALDSAVISDYWPNVLTTVAELNKSSLGEAIGSMGGKWMFFIGLAGLLLLLLPRHNPWKLKHYAVFAAGLLISLYLVTGTDIGKFTALALIALPIAGALLLYLFGHEDIDIAPALIILLWFIAAVYATYSGVRFILLLIPAFGIGFAVTAGRAYEWLSAYGRKEIHWHPYITNVLVFILIALLLVQPIRTGRDTARGYIPSIDDAWWDALTKLRETSSPDAVINSWWDFGHWFKYVADRRVSADGTTQHTHVPRWLGLALVSPNEDESMGTLRMLDCGSDAYPGREGDLGAYGRILNKTNDPVRAQQMVRDIILMDEEAARQYLARNGFTPEEQDRVLSASHCQPPEDYFITSGDMIGKAGVWAHFGLWNFTKAYAAQKSRTLTHDEAVSDFQERFNMSYDDAEKLYYDARSLANEGDINSFAAPWPGYITTSWVQCTVARDNTSLLCPAGVGIGQQGNTITAIDAVIYNGSQPNASKVVYGAYQNGQRVGQNSDGTPALLIVADGTKLTQVPFPEATSRGLGVLIDVPNRRMLLADPLLINSMFTQLYYLDGKYTTHFEKFDDRTSFTGSRVVIWKVDWAGTQNRAAANTTAAAANSGAASSAARTVSRTG